MKRTIGIIILIITVLSASIIDVSAKSKIKTIGFLTFRDFDTYCWVTKCDTSAKGEIIIPASVSFDDRELPVTAIKEYKMEGGAGETPTGPFSDCKDITGVVIPDSVTLIGYYAFSECTGLKSVTIPDSVTEINQFAFENCTGLTSINIPDSVTAIGNYAFSGCNGITSVTVPKNITDIGINPFSGCNNLETISIAESNKNYSTYDGVLYSKDKSNIIAFPGAKSDNFTIPDYVTHIGAGAFSNCIGLKNISIPSSVTHIENSAFSNCTGLKNVLIPDSVTFIGNSAFSGCKELKSINIPENVTNMGYGVFYSCESLQIMKIPDGMTRIETDTFSKCINLTGIIIPESLTDILMSAFDNCINLKTVYYKGNEKQWEKVCIEDDMFDGNRYIRSADVVFNYKESDKGDINGDGFLDNKDVVELFRAVSGNPSAKFVEANADFNGDGSVDNKDVVSLFRYVSSI